MSRICSMILVVAAATLGASFSLAQSAPIKQDPSALLIGQVEATCYSGFRAGQHPDRGDGANNPTDAQILEDLRLLVEHTPHRLIRLYDSRENSEAVLRIIRENQLPIRVMLGAWLSAELSNPNCPWMPEPYPDEVLAANIMGNAAEVRRAVELANEYDDIVVAVNVGNEALVSWTDHLVPLDKVIGYVREVKAGIEQPVTVAENYEWWAQSGEELAAELDFVGVHLYPIWEQRDIDEGLSYSIENMQRVRDALPDATLAILEAGWATTASEFGDRASEAKQTRYYTELMDWSAEMNITTFFFAAFDESWKGDPNNPMGAEKHWGVFFEDRQPKQVVETLRTRTAIEPD
ncbi:MAG: glycosyl hydrolase family 17 protein [Planctomycetota bacterium]